MGNATNRKFDIIKVGATKGGFSTSDAIRALLMFLQHSTKSKGDLSIMKDGKTGYTMIEAKNYDFLVTDMTATPGKLTAKVNPRHWTNMDLGSIFITLATCCAGFKIITGGGTITVDFVVPEDGSATRVPVLKRVGEGTNHSGTVFAFKAPNDYIVERVADGFAYFTEENIIDVTPAGSIIDSGSEYKPIYLGGVKVDELRGLMFGYDIASLPNEVSGLEYTGMRALRKIYAPSIVKILSSCDSDEVLQRLVADGKDKRYVESKYPSVAKRVALLSDGELERLAERRAETERQEAIQCITELYNSSLTLTEEVAEEQQIKQNIANLYRQSLKLNRDVTETVRVQDSLEELQQSLSKDNFNAQEAFNKIKELYNSSLNGEDGIQPDTEMFKKVGELYKSAVRVHEDPAEVKEIQKHINELLYSSLTLAGPVELEADVIKRIENLYRSSLTLANASINKESASKVKDAIEKTYNCGMVVSREE